MVDYSLINLFNKSSVDKQFKIVSDDETVKITNNELHFEKFELKETLCSEQELKFGCCESSCLKFTVSNVVLPMIDKWLNASVVLDKNEDNPFVFGRFKVYSDTPTADRTKRTVVAYDKMYEIINSDVVDWYNSLEFPMTMKEFRTSFVSYFELEQEEITLANDYMTIDKTIETNELSGKDVITSICEVNGCFGKISRSGKFKYVYLEQGIQALYPSDDLYPSDELFPTRSDTESLGISQYISCTYEDYISRKITKLQIRQEENDVGVIIGDGDNAYIIENNFLFYGYNSENLQRAAQNLYEVIKQIEYRPAKISARGNPCREVGDSIRLYTKHQIVETYILERTITGIQSLKDSYASKGVYSRSNKVNTLQRQIIQLQGRTNVIKRTVDETVSVVSKKVGEDEIISKINQSAEEIGIEAKKIKLEGYVSVNDSFSIDEDGNFSAVGGSVGGWAVGEHGIYNDSLQAGFINLGAFRLYVGGFSYEEMIELAEEGDTYPYFGVTDSGRVVCQELDVFQDAYFNSDCYVYGTLYTASGGVSASDKDLKKDFSDLDKDKSSEFIYSLKPKEYKFIDGTSDRFHHGFLAQELKESMGEDDWGVYVDKNPYKPGNKGIRYEEIIADMVATIQKQHEEIDELKDSISFLLQKEGKE